jgi:hypothetical protein
MSVAAIQSRESSVAQAAHAYLAHGREAVTGVALVR